MNYYVGMKINVNGSYPIIEEIVFMYGNYLVTKGITYFPDELSLYGIEGESLIRYHSDDDYPLYPLVAE